MPSHCLPCQSRPSGNLAALVTCPKSAAHLWNHSSGVALAMPQDRILAVGGLASETSLRKEEALIDHRCQCLYNLSTASQMHFMAGRYCRSTSSRLMASQILTFCFVLSVPCTWKILHITCTMSSWPGMPLWMHRLMVLVKENATRGAMCSFCELINKEACDYQSNRSHVCRSQIKTDSREPSIVKSFAVASPVHGSGIIQTSGKCRRMFLCTDYLY